MDSVKPPTASNGGRLIRAFTKFLRFRIPHDTIRKINNGPITGIQSESVDNEEILQHRVAMEALLAKLFASISSIKALYAQLQLAQSPYNADAIQSTDEKLVSEFKFLSKSKKNFLKKEIDPSPQVSQLLAENQEQQSLIKTYEIMVKKIESQLEVKDSEVYFFREKLGDLNRHDCSLEKRLNTSGSLAILENLHFSGLKINHFIKVRRNAIKSIQSFVKLMISQMKLKGWDFDAMSSSIEPNVTFLEHSHKFFALESFVCREMFESFNFRHFCLRTESLPGRKNQHRRLFFDRFTELISEKSKQFLSRNPNSTFGEFCRAKYMQLVHPKMESSFFGDLKQREMLNSGEYPDTEFFSSFAEMAKWVWLLHSLAFSLKPEASIFIIDRGNRFSEVFMETVTEDVFFTSNKSPEPEKEANLRVGFTVSPGFLIGKTVIQCQVYVYGSPV